MRRTIFLLLSVLLITACDRQTAPRPTATPAPGKELIFTDWEDDMPQEVIDSFTAQTGIQVQYIPYSAPEDALAALHAGTRYDVMVLDNRYIPALMRENMLARINPQNIPNLKNISANFRDMVYDPGNRYLVPYNWGTTGLIVRNDLTEQPIRRWADLWQLKPEQKVFLWETSIREMMGMALKSLGYSINTEDPIQLEAALQHLLALGERGVYLEEVEPDLISNAGLLAEGKGVAGVAWSYDAITAREINPNAVYLLPEEGALLWGDNFVIPANSPNKIAAEMFINFILQPEISASITNTYHYPTANEPAQRWVEADILNDPIVYPPNRDLTQAEIILPLSPRGDQLYAEIWAQLLIEIKK